MSNDQIAFVGGGNMATSLIGGLVADGCPGDRIRVSDPDRQRLGNLSARFGVHAADSNHEAASGAAAVVLAVKPQMMATVVPGVADAIRTSGAVTVSIAAGVRESTISRWLGFDAPVVRSMPNTPALLRCGASAMFANAFVDPAQRSTAESILRAVGITLWVDDENLLDSVTALSGSGPAYYFLLMEMMEDTGCALGLEREAARMLTLQTALGAARMALEAEDSPATLRERVTSPGGTTERAIECLRNGGIERLAGEALRAARDRSVELGRALGDGD